MPNALPKPCNWPGCPELIPRRERFCSRHQAAHKEQAPKRDYSDRPSFRDRGYTTRWDRFSRYMRRKFPVCQCCDRNFSAVVDHIIPKASGGLDTELSCWALCTDCHNKKTARFDGGNAGGRVSRIYCGMHSTDPNHIRRLRNYLREAINHA